MGTEFCAQVLTATCGRMPPMPRGTPKLATEASDQARSVHAFLVANGLTMRGWSRAAGLSRNVLVELFSGRTRGLTYRTLAKLAVAAGASPSQIIGAAGMPTATAEMVALSDVVAAIVRWCEATDTAEPESVAAHVIALLP